MVNFGRKNIRRTNRYKRNRYRAPSVFSNQMIAMREVSLPSWFYKMMFFVVILIALVYFVFFSATFSVKDVFVEGNHFASTPAVSSFIPKGSNIFRLNTTNIKKNILLNVPEVKDLTIYRGIPNAVKVVVFERDARVLWQSGSDTYLLSSQGEIAKKVDSNENVSGVPKVIDLKNLPVKVGSKVASPNFINFILAIQNDLQPEVNIKPLDFSIEETTFDVNLATDSGFYVKFNSLRSPKSQIANLRKVMAAKKPDIHEYVDLRIDGWAYYK